MSKFDDMYALHVGVVAGFRGPHVGGETSIRREVEVGHLLNLSGGERAWVSGSWEVWGPEDQEGNDWKAGLHLLLYLEDMPDKERLRELRWRIRMATAGARIVDTAFLTPATDWSDKTHVIDWSVPSSIYTYTTGERVDRYVD